MKAILLMLVLFCPFAFGAVIPPQYNQTCNFPFTHEQLKILRNAHGIGEDDDLSYTLQAIATKESFIWNRVVRIREVNDFDTSYGVTHLRPTTAQWIMFNRTGYETNIIKEFVMIMWLRQKYGDDLSLNLTLHYLNYKLVDQGKSWNQAVGEYNAGWRWKTAGKQYTKDIKTNIKYYQKCWPIIREKL